MVWKINEELNSLVYHKGLKDFFQNMNTIASYSGLYYFANMYRVE